ncbi:hypothetical protein FOZ63_029407 [Perkinsus olseni]|uniref:Uncharacterized protein n=1 Tax=Perkinsus olseni TaxID=32597 RepID=A0A7J6TYF8_PEROL|nr:hypothetical protein FOZ63_029407 [Perkinsus olseni]
MNIYLLFCVPPPSRPIVSLCSTILGGHGSFEGFCFMTVSYEQVDNTSGGNRKEEDVEAVSTTERHIFESVLDCILAEFPSSAQEELLTIRSNLDRLFTELPNRTVMMGLLEAEDTRELRRILFYPVVEEDIPRYMKAIHKVTRQELGGHGTKATKKLQHHLICLLYLWHSRSPRVCRAAAESEEGMLALVELFGDANVFLAGQAIDTFRRIVTTPMVDSPTTSIWDRDACPGVHHLVLKRVCLSPVLWASFHKLTKGEDAYPNERAGYAQLLAFCLEYLSKCWVNGSSISVPPRLAIGKRLDRILSELEASDPDIHGAFGESITEAYPVGPDNRSPPEVLKDQLLDGEQVQWCKNSILKDTTEAERNAGRAAELRDLGNCMTRAKKYEHALSCYEYSLQWNNSEPLAYSNMALCNLKLSRWADAVSAADSAIVGCSAASHKALTLVVRSFAVSSTYADYLMTEFPRSGPNHETNGVRQRLSGEDTEQMLLSKQVTLSRKGHSNAFPWLSARPWRSREDFEAFVSSSVDVFKGWFIIFMLVEHTRSSFHVGMDMAHWPIMHVFSKAACALDMTCFSTAYGFMCYRSYFVNTKNRPLSTTLTRVFRSVSLVLLALIFMNITFSLSVVDHMPAMRETLELITVLSQTA